MANPFFSGRIPQDLLDRVEQHVKETGQSKTDILIQAVATYLNHPVSKMAPALANSEIEERFRSLEVQIETLQNLESRITTLELEMLFGKTSDKEAVIKSDNRTQLDVTCFDEEELLVGEENFWQENTDNDIGKKNEDAAKTTLQDQDKPIYLLPEYVAAKFENLTSPELIEASSLKRTQIDGYKSRISKRLQKEGRPLEDKQLLETPEKVETKQVITIQSYPYDLFYLGQNEKGNNLWSVIPYDNERYQQMRTKNVELFFS